MTPDIIYFKKVLSSLPTILEPNTLYCVRVSAGFDFYISNSVGNIAHKLNLSDSANGSIRMLENIPRFAKNGTQWIFKSRIGKIEDLYYRFGGFPLQLEYDINMYKLHTKVEEGIVYLDLDFDTDPFPSKVLLSPVLNTILWNFYTANPITVSGIGLQFEDIEIYLNDTLLTSVSVDLNGQWSYYIDNLLETSYVIKYRVKDTKGNYSDFSPIRTFIYDTSTPSLNMTITDIMISNDSNIQGDYITTDRTLTLTGNVNNITNRQRAEINIDGTWSQLILNDGAFSIIDNRILEDGNYIYGFRIISDTGVIGNQYSINVVIDNVTPGLVNID